ncbi:MAG: hypothetical protein PHH13_03715 [Candidatus Peribacteraceae bacterium]|nr:hypothetical protein [Candidatus Peribacteraceae bacterium]
MVWFALLVGLALLVLVGMFWALRRRALPAAARARIRSQWTAMLAIPDPARRVMEADAILDGALTVLRYRGSLGDKLKAAEPRMRNIDAVWRAHKLRNRIAHEPGSTVTSAQVQEAVSAIGRALEGL